MKQYRLIQLLSGIGIVCTMFGPASISAQVPDHYVELLKSGVFNERLRILTDRSMYSVSEKIHFKVYNLSHSKIKELGWSEILYVELTDASGASLANGKFPIKHSESGGYIRIPETVTTGNYYIRTYTKWMRNDPPHSYAYSRIKIINPYNEDSPDYQYYTDVQITTPGVNVALVPVAQNEIGCMSDREKYKRREKGTIQIAIAEGTRSSPEGYCVSVVKSAAIDSCIYGLTLQNISCLEPMSEIRYYPETKGLSLSGRVVQKGNHMPAAHAVVHLSMLGEDPRYFGYHTDSDGQFYFVIPDMHGIQNFYIGAETKDDHPVEILVDNDFSTGQVILPYIPFILPGDEEETAREITFNMQIEKVFKPSLYSDSTNNNSLHGDYLQFYGEPVASITIDDYIALPTLEDFFYELIPEVILMRRKDEPYFMMKGKHSDLAIYKPLILLDMVPVSDVGSILEIPPEMIHRFETVNATFLRGNMHYGGIISIFSRNGDLAGIKLPENSFFFDSKTFEPQEEIEFPDYSGVQNDYRTPDLRNCLYWNPDVRVRPGETVSLEFFTSDSRGAYTILVRGVSADGTIVEGQSSFVVE